jgi:hypothetical protein
VYRTFIEIIRACKHGRVFKDHHYLTLLEILGSMSDDRRHRSAALATASLLGGRLALRQFLFLLDQLVGVVEHAGRALGQLSLLLLGAVGIVAHSTDLVLHHPRQHALVFSSQLLAQRFTDHLRLLPLLLGSVPYVNE